MRHGGFGNTPQRRDDADEHGSKNSTEKRANASEKGRVDTLEHGNRAKY